jgi:phage tail tape-measure protein
MRERLRQLEREADRQRDILHAFRSEVASVRYLAEKIGELASDVKDLGADVRAVSRQAVHRPSQSALSVFGQYLSLIVAVLALLIAATR